MTHVYRTPRFIPVASAFVAFLFSLALLAVPSDPANAVVALIGLPPGLWAAHTWRARAEVGPDRLRYRSLRASHELAWEDIAEVYHRHTRSLQNAGALLIGGILWRGSERITLVPYEGPTVRLTTAVTRKEIAARIQEATLPHLLPRYREAFERGQRLVFGPITVSQAAGLEIKQVRSRAMPLDELDSVRVKRGNLGVKRLGDRRAGWVPIEKVPNFHVLQALLAELAPQPAAAIR